MTQIALGIAISVTKTEKENCWYCKEKKKDSEHESNLERGDVAGWKDKVEKKSNLSWQKSRKYRDVVPEAHHLIPVKSMNRISQIHKLIECSHGEIDDDIGYDLNHPNNSVWLPGRPVPKSSGKKIALIKDANSQIHNSSHPDYRRNVRTILTEIHTKINKKKKSDKCPMCGKKMESKRKAPYGLVGRLDAVSRKLKKLLTGSPRYWKLDEGYYTFSRSLKDSVKAWKKEKKL